ncbi:hypothetical protein ACH5RR_026737 [Cinchona calisaya]|uniref:Disease resistance R13L4/SHOC-2-like LRR domain-containing protein n=1 Tax=Cinchona calisaya TaxID=153742 RepID=A0ABD2Z6T9_9GENT
MKDNIRRVELLISILSPLVRLLFQYHINPLKLGARLKPIDEAVKNMIQDFKPPPKSDDDDDDDSGSNKQCGYSSPTNLQLLLSNLNKLQSLKEEIKEILSLHSEASISALFTWEKAEHLFPDEGMAVSIQALIFKIGFLVYLSLDDEQEGEELMAKHLSFGLPVLFEAFGALRQQASDLFNGYLPLSWQSKHPSNNELEFVNLFIKELEDLMCSEPGRNRIFSLKYQIDMINKEMVTLRKCFSEISELENTQMEFLFTRFTDAAYLAKCHQFIFGRGRFTLVSKVGPVAKTLIRLVVLGNTRTSQRRHLSYGAILRYEDLTVLDLGNVRIQNSADTSDLVKIAKLVHLKHLAVRVRTIEIPSEIGNLQNLETFILSGVVGEVMLLESIWKLVSSRYLIMDHSFFSLQHYGQEFFENACQLNNLKSISTLSIGHANAEKFLRRLPNIQKLGCRFSNSWHAYYEACNLFRILEFLSELQSLKMSFHDRAPFPFKFSFPSNLKKLIMSNAHLSWDQVSVIGQLPNLEWNASSEHLPCLEQLLVLSCQRLEVIPCSFGEIPTLELIEMKWCSASVVGSVKQILEEQRDLSNDQLKVIVVG